MFVHPHQLWHFLAYARGAAQVFIDTVVPSAAAGLQPAIPPDPAPAPSPAPHQNIDPQIVGWTLFRNSCLNPNPCPARPGKRRCGANCCCADGSLIGETKCAAGSSRPECVQTAMARCQSTPNCTAVSLMGGCAAGVSAVAVQQQLERGGQQPVGLVRQEKRTTATTIFKDGRRAQKFVKSGLYIQWGWLVLKQCHRDDSDAVLVETTVTLCSSDLASSMSVEAS